jgi:hypothetical protein
MFVLHNIQGDYRPNQSTAASTVLNIATKYEIDRSEV